MDYFSDIIIVVLATIIVVVGVKYGLKWVKEKKAQLERERLELENKIRETLNLVRNAYQHQLDYINEALLNKNHYFAYSEFLKIKEDNKTLYEEMDFLNDNGALSQLGEDAIKFYAQLKELDYIRIQHNNEFVNKELVEQKEFFDSILDYPLDKQQRESIVKLEDNCLVISSAGSGKTSTMIGKLQYLVLQRKIQPTRILTITYTHKAAEELTQRLLDTGLNCLTFHKLAMTIVAKVEGKKPTIAENGLFLKVFYKQLENSNFRDAIIEYLTDYKSLVKNEHDYNSSIEYYKDRKKYGVIALYTDKDNYLISTKSEEEKKICCYLTELGVSFKYEEPYEFETLTEEYRQYKPDFTIYYKDKAGAEKKLYLEHYAINAYGQVPKWFGNGTPDGWSQANQKYLEGIAWKKQVHRKFRTNLISTTSTDFHENKIRERLSSLLENAGVPICQLSSAELMEKIMSRNKSLENALLQMTQSFITLIKANGKTIEDMRKIAKSKHSKRDLFVIDNIMQPLWTDYQEMLAERNEMDFTDVIVKATQYCNAGEWHHKYEYILIDEFQDISVDRYNFLLSLRSELPKTKLYCVGDDWQSIYRFSGSDMSLFTDFSKYFGFTEECKIETSYRFGNPLIDESSRFIQRNPLQKQKKVRPSSTNSQVTSLSFKSYKTKQDLQQVLEKMIARVPQNKTIMIISRYTNDVDVLVSPNIQMEYNQNTDKIKLLIAGRKVTFMTIHSSKGLEADYVFMLNCNSGLYGFPSLISDDPILDYVLSKQDHFEYAEERRVFYVGITRAKVHTVVMYDEDMPSPFVSEMKRDVLINPNPCPLCGVGHRIIKYEGFTKQKTPYRVWGCDNKDACCQYFEREFSNGKNMKLTGKKFIPKNPPAAHLA